MLDCPVPQFTTAAMYVIGTSYIAMLPDMMARRLADFLDLRAALCGATNHNPQVWHSRTDADPALQVLRSLIRDSE
jgi:hypothetical protein